MKSPFQLSIWHSLIAFVLVTITLTMGCSSKDDGSSPSGIPGTIDGTWSGAVSDTYYCEPTSGTIEFDINASTITISAGNAFATGTTGTISAGADNSYSITVDNGGNEQIGQLYFDPSSSYALITMYTNFGGNGGYVGVLQKGALTNTTYQESDLIGDWTGTAVRVDANFLVTESSPSSMTIGATDLVISGSDGDGTYAAGVAAMPEITAIPGIVLEPSNGNANLGIFVSGDAGAGSVDWPATTESFAAIYAMSRDKRVLAAGYLIDTCTYRIFDDLPGQKFAIWTKQ